MKKGAKIGLGVLALVIVGGIYGANQKGGSSNNDVKITENKNTQGETKQEENKIELNKEMKIGKYSITFTEYKIVKDSNDKPALRVTYDWINNDEKPATPFLTFSLKGFQDNVETDNNVLILKDVDLGKGQKEVKPGGKITGAHAIVGIESLDKPLNLELEELMSLNSKPIKTELNLKDIK